MPVKNQVPSLCAALFFQKLLKQVEDDGLHSPFVLQHGVQSTSKGHEGLNLFLQDVTRLRLIFSVVMLWHASVGGLF